MIPWTVVCQAPLATGFPRREYWSVLPFPSPGHLPDPGTEPGFPSLQTDSLTLNQQGSPESNILSTKCHAISSPQAFTFLSSYPSFNQGHSVWSICFFCKKFFQTFASLMLSLPSKTQELSHSFGYWSHLAFYISHKLCFPNIDSLMVKLRLGLVCVLHRRQTKANISEASVMCER